MTKTLKKISTTVLFLSLFFASYSQTKKATLVLSGKTDLNFLFSNTTISRDSMDIPKSKNNQFGFNLGVGYFVADNFALALSGAYSYTDNKFEPFDFDPGKEAITTTLAVVPQMIYYFPSEGKLKPSLNIGAGYLWLKQRASYASSNNNIVYSISGSSFNGAAGVSYFITKSIAFDVGLQYTHNRLRDKMRMNEIQNQNIVAGTLGVTIFFFK